MNAALQFYNSTTIVPGRKEQRGVKKQLTKPLNMTVHPEEKRKIIGDTFMKVQRIDFVLGNFIWSTVEIMYNMMGDL